MSDIYWGAKAFKALYVSSNILKDIRCLAGSQWRSIKTGVMILSYLQVRETKRPAALWTRWSLSIKVCGSSANSELQLSSLVVMNAWTNVSVSFRERQFLILDRLRIWQKATLQIWLICCSRSIKLSKITDPYVSSFYWLSYFNTSDCNLVCCWARAIFGMYYLKTLSRLSFSL